MIWYHPLCIFYGPSWLNTQVHGDFSRSPWPFWMTLSSNWKVIRNYDAGTTEGRLITTLILTFVRKTSPKWWSFFFFSWCHQTSNTNRTFVGNKIVAQSDVVGAYISNAPATSSFSTWHLASMDWAKATARRDEKHLSFGSWCTLF